MSHSPSCPGKFGNGYQLVRYFGLVAARELAVARCSFDAGSSSAVIRLPTLITPGRGEKLKL